MLRARVSRRIRYRKVAIWWRGHWHCVSLGRRGSAWKWGRASATMPPRRARSAGSHGAWEDAWKPRSSARACADTRRSEEHTSELQSPYDLVCRLLLEKKNIRIHKTGEKYSLGTVSTSMH